MSTEPTTAPGPRTGAATGHGTLASAEAVSGPAIASRAAARARGLGRLAITAIVRAVPVLLLTAAVTFALGAFAKQEPADLLLGEAATPEALAELNHELGRDRPLVVQFGSVFGDKPADSVKHKLNLQTFAQLIREDFACIGVQYR